MHTLILKTDDTIYEQLKNFLALIPKDKIEMINPYEIGIMSDDEQAEIKALLADPATQELVAESRQSYTI